MRGAWARHQNARLTPGVRNSAKRAPRAAALVTELSVACYQRYQRPPLVPRKTNPRAQRTRPIRRMIHRICSPDDSRPPPPKIRSRRTRTISAASISRLTSLAMICASFDSRLPKKQFSGRGYPGPLPQRFGDEENLTSGRADRLPLDHVHDRDQDDGSDERDDERDDQAGRLRAEEQREDKAADERADDAEDNVPDDAVAVPAHDLAGQPSDDGPHDQKPDEMHLQASR